MPFACLCFMTLAVAPEEWAGQLSHMGTELQVFSGCAGAGQRGPWALSSDPFSKPVGKLRAPSLLPG